MKEKLNEIIKVFFDIAKPFEKDKADSPKAVAIKEKLKKLNPVFEKEIGLIVPAKKERKYVIVSHMDLIPLFNNVFSGKKKKEPLKIKDKNVEGALDNTITNAVLIQILLEEPSINDYVEVLFSQEEETGGDGVKNYMKKLKKEKVDLDKIFFFNLDVTNDQFEKNISAEYDKPCWNFLNKLKKICGEEIGIQKDRVGDDLDSVLYEGGHGISLCLPTKNTIHSMKNKTKKEKIVGYYESLKKILLNVHEFDMQSHECDLGHYLSIEEALQAETKEEFEKLKKEAEEEYKKRYNRSYQSRFDLEYQSYQRSFRESYYEDEDSYFESKLITQDFLTSGSIWEDASLKAREALEMRDYDSHQAESLFVDMIAFVDKEDFFNHFSSLLFLEKKPKNKIIQESNIVLLAFLKDLFESEEGIMLTNADIEVWRNVAPRFTASVQTIAPIQDLKTLSEIISKLFLYAAKCFAKELFVIIEPEIIRVKKEGKTNIEIISFAKINFVRILENEFYVLPR